MTKHLYLFLLIYHFYGFVAHIVILFEYVALDMILYHGTNTIVEHPEVRICGYNKDFGFGFYCTQFERQAKRWALTKRGKHIVCVYDYTPLKFKSHYQL